MSTLAVNSITLVGHLTSDPALRTLEEGRSVCDMRLAVNDSASHALFVDVTTFDKAAEACAEYLTKGRQVAITGRLAFREWEAPDGTRHSKHYVIGRVQFGAQRPGEQAPSADEAE